MATGSRPYMLDMSRTTTIIGELIQLITEQEDVTERLGKEGYAYYKAGLFYDEMTLEMCRRIEGSLKEVQKSKKELEDGLEENLLLNNGSNGPFSRMRKAFFTSLMQRETAHHERALREYYDELAGRIQGIANNDPRSLSAKMLKMCMALRRVKRDIDLRWAELEERTKTERKGPMFLLILNMFVINFFKFSNHTWFRHWIARMQAFQSEIGERIHREVVHDLSVDDEQAVKAPASASPEPGLHDLDDQDEPADESARADDQKGVGFPGQRAGESPPDAAPAPHAPIREAGRPPRPPQAGPPPRVPQAGPRAHSKQSGVPEQYSRPYSPPRGPTPDPTLYGEAAESDAGTSFRDVGVSASSASPLPASSPPPARPPIRPAAADAGPIRPTPPPRAGRPPMPERLTMPEQTPPPPASNVDLPASSRPQIIQRPQRRPEMPGPRRSDPAPPPSRRPGASPVQHDLDQPDEE